jgi:hypothetical protein
MLHSLFYLTTALHVLGVTITHLQEHKTTVTTASDNRYTVTAIYRYRGRVGTDLSVLCVAHATHSTLKPVPYLLR